MKKPVLIGIAGGSASGKTSVSRRIQQEFGDTNTVLIIRQDDYYKDQSDMTMDERTKVNYDHPFAFDNDLFVAQLKQLMNHQAIEKPTYDFVKLTRSPLTEHCEPADVIVVEGLFVLEDEQIRSLLNIKVFIDAPADVRFIRRLIRDVKERGRNLDWVVDQYLGTVRPMHDIFIEPSKRYADIIIPQGGQNEVAVDLLNTKIASIIHHPLD
ncbi:uridine kinase [Galactobacillus timonensis]|uniref:uridine kinase n=1 Tax=Galactobacillus timonensis TaxID=2041840 RepID=UPI000C82CB3C|nr:uridine kinase [Galactobacillus timonensis]